KQSLVNLNKHYSFLSLIYSNSSSYISVLIFILNACASLFSSCAFKMTSLLYDQYAPRPLTLPVVSIKISLSFVFTKRIKSSLGFNSCVTKHVLKGTLRRLAIKHPSLTLINHLLNFLRFFDHILLLYLLL